MSGDGFISESELRPARDRVPSNMVSGVGSYPFKVRSSRKSYYPSGSSYSVNGFVAIGDFKKTKKRVIL